MNFLSLFLLFCTTYSVTAVATSSGKAFSSQTLLDLIVQNENLLPLNSRLMLRQFVRLQEQTLSKRSQAAIDPDFAAYVANLPGGMALLEAVQVTGNAPKPPASSVKDIQDSKGTDWPNSIKRKVRYGPFRLPATSEKNVASEILKIQGVSNYLNFAIKKPCEAECVILRLNADLEYADGSAASTKNGAWLHHVTLINAGPDVIDAGCGKESQAETLFMGGNEKSDSGFGVPGSSVKSGYRISNTDSFTLTTELMNMEDKEKWAWVTMTYEILEGRQPDYKLGKMIFMSIGPSFCDNTQKNPFGKPNMTEQALPTSLKFVEHSIPWKSPKDGYVLETGGHMHDGGTSTEVYINGKMICDSKPIYAKSKPLHEGHGRRRKRQINLGGGTEDNKEIEHIQKQEACHFKDGIPIKKGDEMYLVAHYDFNVHPGMKNKKGELDQIMGIAGSIIAF